MILYNPKIKNNKTLALRCLKTTMRNLVSRGTWETVRRVLESSYPYREKRERFLVNKKKLSTSDTPPESGKGEFQIKTPTILAGFHLTGDREKDFKEAIQLVHKVFFVAEHGMESIFKKKTKGKDNPGSKKPKKDK